MEPRSHQSLQVPGTLLLGLQICTSVPGMGAKDHNEASTLPTEPSPQPQRWTPLSLSWKNSFPILSSFLIHTLAEAQPQGDS